jgi:Effector protein
MSRYWGKNIVIDGSTIREEFEDPLPTLGPPNMVVRDTTNPKTPAYEYSTQEVLRQIERTAVGGMLIRQINSSPHTLTIRALNERASLDQTRTIWADERAPGQRAASRGGGGTDVTMWYEPAAWSRPSAKASIDPANHFHADDVLFHELVHALRMMRGLMDLVKIRDWDNIEDLFAIMLTNIYNSSNNRNNDLRGDHNVPFRVLGNSPLRPTEQIDDQAFYTYFSTDIDRLWLSLPDLCLGISRVSCRWNSLRARVNSVNSRIFPMPQAG